MHPSLYASDPHTPTGRPSHPAIPGIESYLPHFSRALTDEIDQIRKGGGQKTYVSDGRQLGIRDGFFIYSFTADAELRFPDDTPIDLEYHGKKHEGRILSIDGFDLILALVDDIGTTIPTAILYTEPWFLLQQLQQRLYDLRTSKDANTTLPARLLSPQTQAQPGHPEQTARLLQPLRQELGASFRCNSQQLKGISQVLANDITFIWGPPGTGKTTTLGMTVAALVAAGESVLVVAHSNAAVDVAMQGVAQHMQTTRTYREGNILRFGVIARTELDAYPFMHVRGIVRTQHPQLIARIESAEERRRTLIAQSRRTGLSASEKQQIKDRIALIKEEIRPLTEQLKQHESDLVRTATVVGCTLSKATIAQEIYQRRFDAVVIDEASMAYIPHCVFVSSLARKRVAIFGDFRQLAPIAQAETPAVQQWLQRDIFAQAGITAQVNAGRGDSRLVLLREQHRMHPAIASVINANFYGGLLTNAPGTAERADATVQKAPHSGHPLVCYDLTPLTACCFSDRESHSRFNPVSALAAIQLAQHGLAAGQPTIGIVTPYNAQSRLIYRLLKDFKLADKPVRVATVHRFQGDENDLIIFDAVDGAPQSKAGRLLQGGMDSTAMRLINVAISRARGKFIGLFNRTYLHTHLNPGDSIHALLQDLTTRTPVTVATWSRQSPQSLFHADLPGLALFEHSQAARESVMQDLRTAREEIAIAWPTRLTPESFNPDVLHQCDASKVRFFISGAGSSAFRIGLRNAQIWEGRSPAIGLVGIDRSRLWLYLNPDDPRAPVLRLDLPHTVKLLAAFWGLVPEDELVERRALTVTCPQCKEPLWLATGKHGVYLRCTGDACAYTRSITPAIATDIARLSGLVCNHCGGMVKGRKGPTGVFLGCANYPDCTWGMSLDSLV